MAKITPEMKLLVNQQKLGFVATTCPDNTPNLSPKGTIMVWEDDSIVFADIKSPQTMANLQKNPSVEVNVVDQLGRKGFRFKGTATILREGEGDTDQFEKIISHYKDHGIKSKINSVVVIKVDVVKEVNSPLYDLGYTEEQLKAEWKKYYLSLD